MDHSEEEMILYYDKDKDDDSVLDSYEEQEF